MRESVQYTDLSRRGHVTRADMLRELNARGWETALFFNERGPVLRIYTGAAHAVICTVDVPVRLCDDHAKSLSDAYCAIGTIIHMANNNTGHC